MYEFKVGDRVLVNETPFKGMPGVILEIIGGYMVRINFDDMDRIYHFWIDDVIAYDFNKKEKERTKYYELHMEVDPLGEEIWA